MRPIRLPNYNEIPKVGSVVTVSGWGLLHEEGAECPEMLRFVDKFIIDMKKCNQTYCGAILDGMMCAGTKEGGKYACQGGSGGPLKLDNTLAGIVSWGDGYDSQRFPGVYTLISEYLDCIEENIKQW